MIYISHTLANCKAAEECEAKGDYEGGWYYLQEALQELDALAPYERAKVLLQAGSIASRTARVERSIAKDWLKLSLTLFEELNDAAGAASACYALALNCRMGGAFSESYGWLDSARARISEADTEGLCKIELLRGLVKRDEGKWREALEVYLFISPLIEVSTSHPIKAKFHGEFAVLRRNLATAEGDSSQFDLALIEYSAASYHFEQAGDTRSLAITKNNTAFLLLKLGKLDEALSEVGQAISIYRQLNDRHNCAHAKETKAQVLLALGRNEEAEIEARESVNMLRIGGERALLIESLITWGRCLARLGQNLKARNTFQAAQEVAEFIEFNHGLGLISLTILEEIGELDIDARRQHHKVVRERLDTQRDAELADRHAACIRSTVDIFKAEMGLDESKQQSFGEGFSLDKEVLEFERKLIELALQEAGGCQKEAARLLGVSPSNLNFKLKNQHKVLKNLQTYGHYRGVKHMSHIDTQTMPNNALSGLGINEGDELVLKKGCRISRGDVALIRSRGKLYIGIYGKEPGKAILAPANSEYATWEIEEGAFEFESKVVGYIPREEVGRPTAQVRTLTNVSSARLPAS